MANWDIEFTDLGMEFSRSGGDRLKVVDGLSCTIGQGEFVCLLGPSGCGKSTLLNIMAGLFCPVAGQVRIGDFVIGPDTQERPKGIGYVFQEPRLLNWLTVSDNLKLVLKAGKVPEQKWDSLIRNYLEMVGLYPFKDSFPLELSGGMQSRVGLIRALIINPNIILMDEPLRSIDEITARKIRAEFMELWSKQGSTVLFVTHDISEAVYMADRVFIMTDKPTRIYSELKIDLARPRDLVDPKLFELEREITRVFYEEVFALG
jgi:ABC-type nitrate/sulfonate/bicarbonate transport system ATPase subunit